MTIMISRCPGPTSETSLFHIPVWNVVSVSLFAIILLSFFAVVNRHPLQIIRLFFIDCSEICFINRAGKIFSLLAAQSICCINSKLPSAYLRIKNWQESSFLPASYILFCSKFCFQSFGERRNDFV